VKRKASGSRDALRKILGLTLGIMTALGGFVDLGQIVFTVQAGALFGYSLLWVIVLGLAAIIIYMEMCGRVAAVAREPVFATVRNRLPKRLGIFTLVASNLQNLVTCAAELGAVAIVLQLLMGWSDRIALMLAAGGIAAMIWFLQFDWIERVFGLTGLLMIVFAVAAWRLGPNWHGVAIGFLPNIPGRGTHRLLLYTYFAVGIFSAMLMEYEVHFYSSGVIEEAWDANDLGENALVASVGSALGGVLTVALLLLGALIFLPRGIFPETLDNAVVPSLVHLGPPGLKLGLLGVLACVGGAAVETALSGAYNVCQFYDWTWSKCMKPADAPAFTFIWMAMLIVATGLAGSGISPLGLINFSIVFAMVVMPFTYYPILTASADPAVLGTHANGRLYNIVGWIFFVLIVIAAVAAIPLAVVTNGGQP
jgi:Mn2+/Fe2+ NRAMP family transporter